MSKDIDGSIKVEEICSECEGFGVVLDTVGTTTCPKCHGTKSNKNKHSNLIIHDNSVSTILDEAKEIVYNDREELYGHPYDDFSKVAGMLNSLFADKLKAGKSFEPEDIPLFQICVKLSRQQNFPKQDNLIDIAGYAATADRVIERQGCLALEQNNTDNDKA